MIRSVRAVLGLTAVAVIVVGSGTAHAWCRTTTVRAAIPGQCSFEGTPLEWQTLCAGYSLYYAGSPEVPLDQIRDAAANAAASWHAAMCDAVAGDVPYFQIQALADTSMPTGYDADGPNANTVSFNSVWASDASHIDGTIAITLVTYDTETGQILDADTELNEQSARNPDGFVFTVGSADPASADLPTILTHEFGHFQGLGHSALDTAVMWPQAGLGEQRRALTDDDVQGICDVYAPATAPTDASCDPVPYGGLATTPTGNTISGGCNIVSTRRVRRESIGFVLLALLGARRGQSSGRGRRSNARGASTVRRDGSSSA